MEVNGISKIAKNFAGTISENSPTILTTFAVAGLISTSILAVKATPKAMRLLAEDQDDRNQRYATGECPKEELYPTKWDNIRITWKCYIPAGIVGVGSIFCIIYSNRVSMRRTAAIASLYGLTEAALKEYQAKVIETIGAGKELAVRDAISGDRIKTNPSHTSEVILTGKGEVLCYDTLSGRYFKSSVEQIKRTINELNATLMQENFLPLNDLYYNFGLSDIDLGKDLGFDIDKGLIEINFSTQLTEEGEPCLVLNFDIFPKFQKKWGE